LHVQELAPWGEFELDQHLMQEVDGVLLEYVPAEHWVVAQSPARLKYTPFVADGHAVQPLA
jgi:hypothetical protein